MYLDSKIKLIPLVKLIKSKFKNFHTRVYHLVVTINISATTESIKKKFCRLISTPASIYMMFIDSFPEVGYKYAQIFF